MNRVGEWYDGLDSLVQFTIQSIGVTIIILWIVIALGSWVEGAHCNDMKVLYGNTQRVEYTFPTGCMLQLNSGYWIDVDDAQYIEVGE